MSNPPTGRDDQTAEDGWLDPDAPHDLLSNERRAFSAPTLVADAINRLRERFVALLVLLAAGVVVAGIDWLLGHDPVPTVGYTGVLDGHVSVSVGIVVGVLSRASTPLSALVGLEPPWLAWTIGLELLEFLAVAGAGAYALARLLGVRLTTRVALRYAALVALLRFASVDANLTGGAVVLAVVLVPLALVFLVRLFTVPGLVIAGRSIVASLRESWRRTQGHGWSLLGVVLLVGLLNHLLASVPVVGPVGSALAGALHAGLIAAFLRQSEQFEGGDLTSG